MSKGGNSKQRRTSKRIAGEITETVLQAIKQGEKRPTSESAGIATLHPLPHYFLRTLGPSSLLAGAASIMIGISFWVCTSCILIGLFILIVDPWIEPALHSYPKGRLAFSLFFGTILIVFCWFVILLPAPLKVEFGGDPGDYPKGEKIGNLTWDCPESCSDFRITITNATDNDYDNVDIHVSLGPDIVILEQGEVLGPPCWFLPGFSNIFDYRYYDNGQEKLAKQLSNGSRVRCDKLPKHTMLQIVYAVTPPSLSNHQSAPKRLPSSVIFNAEYTVRSRPRIVRINQDPIAYIAKEPIGLPR